MSVRARGRRQIAIKQQRKPGYALSTRPSSRLSRAAALSAVAERGQGKGPTIRSSKTQLPAVGRLHESGSAQAASLKLSLYKRLEGRSMKRSVDLRPIPARLLHRSPGIETLPAIADHETRSTAVQMSRRSRASLYAFAAKHAARR